MSKLSLETLAIVRATFQVVEARRPEITLRMWHYLPHGSEGDMLFVSYRSGGAGLTLVEALLTAIRQRESGGDRATFRLPSRLMLEHCPEREAMSEAFVRALEDVLGPAANAMVLNAWRQLLDAFFIESCGHEEAGPSKAA